MILSLRPDQGGDRWSYFQGCSTVLVVVYYFDRIVIHGYVSGLSRHPGKAICEEADRVASCTRGRVDSQHCDCHDRPGGRQGAWASLTLSN
jgi:hypothetical protein